MIWDSGILMGMSQGQKTWTDHEQQEMIIIISSPLIVTHVFERGFFETDQYPSCFDTGLVAGQYMFNLVAVCFVRVAGSA